MVAVYKIVIADESFPVFIWFNGQKISRTHPGRFCGSLKFTVCDTGDPFWDVTNLLSGNFF